MFDERGVIFWPVGTGDSTTFVVREDEVIMQIDLRHLSKSEDDDDDHAAIIDELEERLPQKDGSPYLSTFALTHPDEDHIVGFENLLERVTIGELWFSPRVFREHTDDLCDDACAFREEAHRRVQATIEAGGDPGAGDRVRIVGYDSLLEEETYKGFPQEFFTIPGNPITMLDGEDHAGEFHAFVHAPFKEDVEGGDKNDTSLALQVVLGDDPSAGGVLMFGDLKYPTIRKIFDESEAHDNGDKLAWTVMLAAHHCSKSVMYQKEDNKLVLKKDILEDMEAAQVGDGVIVSSSESVPSSNSAGDNPPHAKAKARYEEIAGGGFRCTHDDGEAGSPLRFVLDGTSLVYSANEDNDVAESSGLSDAVKDARGSDDTPGEKVGFGR